MDKDPYRIVASGKAKLKAWYDKEAVGKLFTDPAGTQPVSFAQIAGLRYLGPRSNRILYDAQGNKVHLWVSGTTQRDDFRRGIKEFRRRRGDDV